VTYTAAYSSNRPEPLLKFFDFVKQFIELADDAYACIHVAHATMTEAEATAILGYNSLGQAYWCILQPSIYPFFHPEHLRSSNTSRNLRCDTRAQYAFRGEASGFTMQR
jgi:hypothetical protein